MRARFGGAGNGVADRRSAVVNERVWFFPQEVPNAGREPTFRPLPFTPAGFFHTIGVFAPVPARRAGFRTPKGGGSPWPCLLGDDWTGALTRDSTLRPFDLRRGLQGFLFLDAVVRAWIWASAVSVTVVLIWHMGWWPTGLDAARHPFRSAWSLAGSGVGWILLYNTLYVAILVALRLVIPKPKEGRYKLRSAGIPNINIIWSCLSAILTKARYQAPFPGFLVFNMANLHPMVWLMGPLFGPKSKSCYVLDPELLDPHLIELGRNITIGYGTVIAAHSQERDEVEIRRTVIKDDVLIGGGCIVYGGCTIENGAVILAGAVLPPHTLVRENEMWGGLPARKIKDLPPLSELSRDPRLVAD